MELYEIDGWCAGAKVEGLSNYTTEEDLNRLVQDAVEELERSCIVASVNILEPVLIKTLKKYGFKKCPWVKNWGHGGRKTCLFVYQIPFKTYKAFGGTNWDN